ncbi:MAG: RpiB/LacA/LacB family sugar-phosphate isomerase [Lachnospiraceae bacterium]|nr:RpiB/LacA/LacB family sugar-phosphate isomerase [Lachnospiraceae bacterium]
MRVVIASDFSGFRLKEAVKEHVLSLGYDLMDVGAKTQEDTTLYYEAASAAAKMIQNGEAERGIVICGTGAGVSMIANKFKGVYAVACESVYTAEKTSLINNANVLAMGEKVVSYAMGQEMAEKWLAGKWCEGFAEQRRLNNERGFAKLQELEEHF